LHVAAVSLIASATHASEPGRPGPGATIAFRPEPARVEVEGLPASTLHTLTTEHLEAETWRQIFAIYVAADGDAAPPPLLGAHRVDDQRLVFTPRFPFRPGLAYRAVFDPAAIPGNHDAALARVETTLTLPATRPAAPAKIAAVYPTGDELPENLLKFYIHFTAPMSRGGSYRHLHILDADGREMPGVFLRLGEELWSPDGRRFTLLFDPARIKRGLVPNLEDGPPLMAGREYTLVIDADWRDADGGRLTAEFRKKFRTTEPDETQPDPHAWKIAAPAAGTSDPLAIEFDEPLDHALAERLIAVRNHAGRDVAGRVRIAEHETRWELTPADVWQAGRYSVVIAGTLEDRAGNSPGRPFEVAGAGDEVGVTSTTQVALPFEVAP
jgi:hypothetical protein